MAGGTRSYEMARRFVAAGHEVHMITSQRNAASKYKGWISEVVDGINVHWIYVPYSNSMDRVQRVVAFLKYAIYSGFKAIKIGGDVVFATSTPLTIALPGILSSKVLKVPMVFEVRDLWPEMPIAIGALNNPLLKNMAIWLEKVAYRNSGHVVALSPGMAAGVRKIGYSKDKISVIPNSCDFDLFQVPESEGKSFLKKYPEIDKGPLIVYAGTLGKINGVGYLIKIAKEMMTLAPSVRFIIVGSGRESHLLQEKAKKLGVLGKNLWMLPALPKLEMPQLLSAATIACSLFVDLPEMWNNSANKFFDALSAGKPVMINYQGWQADLLRETGAGIVVPANDPDKSATILYEFISNKKKLEKSGKVALQIAKDRFDRDKLAQQLLSCLVKVVEKTE